MRTDDFSAGPLTGIKIIDLTQVVAGPFATQLLAEQGAEVVKVESLTGDLLRGGRIEGFSAIYANTNRGKRSIALDLKTDAGLQVVLDLTRDADVFVENFRPGVCDRLGLGENTIRETTPDIIHVSINGFGPTGPYADRPALDPIMQGYTGMVSGQASDEFPFPDFIRTTAADKAAAYTAAQAITAALYARDHGAGGQHLEVPLLDSALAWYWVDGMADYTQPDNTEPSRRIADAFRLIDTSDGQVVYYTATSERMAGLLRTLGRPDLAADDRYSNLNSLAANPEYQGVTANAIADGLGALTTTEAIDRLTAEGVPCGPILDRSEVANDPQVRHNKCLVEWEHPVIGRLRQAIPAVRFSATPAQLRREIDELGASTVDILIELGRENDQIEALRRDGVLLT